MWSRDDRQPRKKVAGGCHDAYEQTRVAIRRKNARKRIRKRRGRVSVASRHIAAIMCQLPSISMTRGVSGMDGGRLLPCLPLPAHTFTICPPSCALVLLDGLWRHLDVPNTAMQSSLRLPLPSLHTFSYTRCHQRSLTGRGSITRWRAPHHHAAPRAPRSPAPAATLPRHFTFAWRRLAARGLDRAGLGWRRGLVPA